jgi:hypothetical protein
MKGRTRRGNIVALLGVPDRRSLQVGVAEGGTG